MSHLGVCIVAYALGYTPVLLLLMARRSFHLEGGPPVWNQIDAATRWDLNFWLWMLASSIVLPVLVEETFFRGYVQTRWMTAFRPMTTIVFIAVVFILIHTQYLDGSIIGTAMIVTGFWWAILLGVARWRTGSLIAPMLAHALSTTPLRPAVQVARGVGRRRRQYDRRADGDAPRGVRVSVVSRDRARAGPEQRIPSADRGRIHELHARAAGEARD